MTGFKSPAYHEGEELSLQALSQNKPAPAGVGGRGIVLSGDGGVALLSGSPALGSQPASAFLYSFYANVNQYNACSQEIKVCAQHLSSLIPCWPNTLLRLYICGPKVTVV